MTSNEVEKCQDNADMIAKEDFFFGPCLSGGGRGAVSFAQPGLSDRLHRINHRLLGQSHI